jgi:hypothetical protein
VARPTAHWTLYSRLTSGRALALYGQHHFAAFHHEHDIAQNADVLERVAGNGNDIREVTWFEFADGSRSA